MRGCGACSGRRASPRACGAACGLLLAYTLLGGGLFLALEGGRSARPAPPAAAALRDATVARLWAITEDLNILYKDNWTRLAADELERFRRALLAGARAADRDDDYRWTFSGSFLYALTLITTIGLGDVAPRSAAGKLAAVAYACVGIPIVMVYLSTVGEALARRFRVAYARLRARPAARAERPRLTPFQAALNLETLPERACGAHARVPAPLGVLPLALYVALGALVFHATEQWDLIEGCYFSFSSLATVGFGDLRPGRRASARARDVALAVCCAYILVGIVVVAMCFNLVQGEGRCARAVHAPPPS